MDWFSAALSAGFSEAAPLNPATLLVNPKVREMCAAGKCTAYGHNHTCPPQCGTLEECQKKMQKYEHGIILLTVGTLEDEFDYEGMMVTEARHSAALRDFAAAIRKEYPNALCLGAGGCRVCKTCAFPEPCRFPDRAYSSMEGYGLLVSEVCKKNNVNYYHGKGTLTNVACALY